MRQIDQRKAKMSHHSAQIEMHKIQLLKITGMEYDQFLKITDEQLDELIKRIPYGDVFELEHIISRLVYLNTESSTQDDMVLTHLIDVLNRGAKDGR